MRDITIGINWEQNSTAALFVDGKVVGCLSEERISRVKNDERYPKNAIEKLLKDHNIKKDELSRVCYVSKEWSPGYCLSRHYTKFSIADYLTEQKEIWYPRLYNGQVVSQLEIFKDRLDTMQYPGAEYWKEVIQHLEGTDAHVSDKDEIEYGIKIRREVVCKHLGISPEKVFFSDHSLSHAAYAYYATTFDDRPRLVLTTDAYGDHVNYSARIIRRNGGDTTEQFICSGDTLIIGRLYRYITLILGLKPNEHEYKVMGLAPYCKPKYYEHILDKFRKMQRVDGLDFKFIERPRDMYFAIKDILDGERFDAISGAVQAYTEELLTTWVSNCIAATGVGEVCLAGGVAMNVKANMMINNLPEVVQLSIPPCPDDSSQAMGAVYAYFHMEQNPEAILKPLQHAYLGCTPWNLSRSNVVTLLENRGYKIYSDRIIERSADLLAKGNIIARIAGREEFGARALGNRSILASPQNVYVKRVINEKIKDRDFWMPFACSIASEFAFQYLHIGKRLRNYSYMTICCDSVLHGEKNPLAAGVHPYDETCRPNIVFAEANSAYHSLIMAFGERTGVFALLNTSLNLHGKPIASSIDDALEVLFDSDLDALLTDDFLAIKDSTTQL